MSDVEPTVDNRAARSVSAETNSDETSAFVDLRNAERVIDLRDIRSEVCESDDESTPRRFDRPDSLDRRPLLGLDFVDAPSLDPVVADLLDRTVPPGPDIVRTVLTPNVDIMVQLDADRSPDSVEWDMFRRSQYCLPDGQPIVAVSYLLGEPLQARLTGSGLFPLLWPHLKAGNRPTYVVASSDEIAKLLREEFPSVRVTVPPMFHVDDRTMIDGIAKAIVESARNEPLEFVILGVGHPKDTRMARTILDTWPSEMGEAPTILALGASASMYVGITKRAPTWVQRAGLEWFHRFVHEPRRLFYRYFVRDAAFVGLVWREWRRSRMLRRADR